MTLTDMLPANEMGRDLPRRDGVAKVTGTAAYAYEAPVGNPAHCYALQATIAKGRIRSIDTSRAEELPGVLTVLTPRRVEQLASTSDAELAVLQSDEIAFRGQIVGAVLADTPEIARQGAELVRIEYDQDSHNAEFRTDSRELYTPEHTVVGSPTDTATGDVDAAMESAAATVRESYSTPLEHHNPMEPHATTALWDPAAAGTAPLTLWESTQGVHASRSAVAHVFGMEPDHVRVVSPYVGGGFGSKGFPHGNTILAVLAARALPGRAVKLALTRRQTFSLAGHRPPTVQHTQLAADADGRLSGVAVDVVQQTSRCKEYVEPTAQPSRLMYAAPNRRSTHRMVRLDVPVPTFMRAPGECPGMFGPEVAMDELACRLGMDPIELRIANEPDVDPDSGKPYSSRNLVACLRDGAERFGWRQREPTPGTRQRDGWHYGTGVAAAIFPAVQFPRSTATIRFSDGSYRVEIGAADIGTGAWTALCQIAADALSVPESDIEIGIGDTEYPHATLAGGSSGTATWGSAILDAANEFREKFGDTPEDGDEAQGHVQPNSAMAEYAMHSYGAQFAEVAVNTATGEIRVPRLLGVFAVGRVINSRTARSQLTGGMTMGLSMALHENSVLDPRFGHVVNNDLAGYHVAAHADIGDVQAHWVDEHDPHVNPLGAKGVGEVGIVGTAAAIANAAYHATGTRLRNLPLTPDKLLTRE